MFVLCFSVVIQTDWLYDRGRIYIREIRNLHVSKLAAATDSLDSIFLNQNIKLKEDLGFWA